MKVRAFAVFALYFVASISVLAQSNVTSPTCSKSSYTNKFICTIPQLFGTDGLLLPNDHHQAHFQDQSTSAVLPLNLAIGQQLSTLPLGSSGSGTTFALDSEGHRIPTEDSLGPILTERASVIGKRAYSLGVAYQYFGFDKIDGIDLHKIPALLEHEPPAQPVNTTIPAYYLDYITTINEIHFSLHQTVIYGVVGISKHMDASVEIPIEQVHFRVASRAHIVRTQPCEVTPGPSGGGDCLPSLGLDDSKSPKGYCGEFHWFAQTTTDCGQIFSSTNVVFPVPGSSPITGAPASQQPPTDASGIGDMIIRGKYEMIHREKLVGSVGLGVRFPSGDAKNFLGTGAYGLIPFGAVTYLGRFSPHVRFGYEWNSHSLLGGDPTSTSSSLHSASLPPAWLYSAGADYRATRRLTIGVDLIGEGVRDAERVQLGSKPEQQESNGQIFQKQQVDVPTISPTSGSYNSDAIAVGGKIRLKKELVLIGNATMRVDDGGLRANVVPLVGLSYAF
jgi:hypothetical protein